MPAGFAPYDLRHGRAGHLLDASGGDMRAVAFLLGHRQLTTTNKYLRGDEGRARRVIGLLDSGGVPGETEGPTVSAKEGSRTLTGVTPLEPESIGPQRDRCDIGDVEGQRGTQTDPPRQGFGGTPETVTTAAKYLAVMRAEWDVFDRLAAEALLDDDEEGS